MEKHLKRMTKQKVTFFQNLMNLLLTYLYYFQNLTTMKKNKSKTLAKVKKTHKCIINFLITTNKNYCKMKQAIKKIWTGAAIAATLTACNVTRVMTNESKCYQQGDTAVTIQTKTIETYSAERRN